jgi:phage terminase large subunit-like protein
MPLDEWQDQALEAVMGERSDGRWASKYVGLSVPRQNGKSQLIVARALAGILLFEEKSIIISAHETDTAREVWKRLIDVVEDNPTLEGRVTGRMDAINREFLSFGKGKDRQTVKLKARRQSGTRGFSCDCLLLDEGQILGKRQWGSINPTMSARPNPQLWLFGTPPTEDDDAFAFTRIRESAARGKARHAWLEWSAEADDDFDDPAVWAKANPSFGVRISEEACADDRAAMDDDQFAMERLGIWQDRIIRNDAFGPEAWESSAEPGVTPDRVAAIGLAVSYDRDFASICATDGTAIGLAERRDGAGWLVPEARRIQDKYGCVVAISGSGPGSDLIPALEAAGVRLSIARSNDAADACAQLFDAIREGRAKHPDHPALNAAVAGARKRLRDDRWVWDRRNSASDISPLEAATLAHWAANAAVGAGFNIY